MMSCVGHPHERRPEHARIRVVFLIEKEHQMKTRLLHELDGQRVFVVVFQTGEEVMRGLNAFVKSQNIVAAQLTAIGALSEAMLAYFDWEKKDYQSIPVREQVEVASLIGDVASAPSGEPSLHVHVVLGRRDGTALAGHLTRAHVRPTLEVIVNESPTHLRKVHDPESGLALIDPNLGAAS
jgi:uncharacterized protein